MERIGHQSLLSRLDVRRARQLPVGQPQGRGGGGEPFVIARRLNCGVDFVKRKRNKGERETSFHLVRVEEFHSYEAPIFPPVSSYAPAAARRTGGCNWQRPARAIKLN